MGYTHYWSIKTTKKKHDLINEERYQLGIRYCQRVIRHYQSTVPKGCDERLSGYSAHTKGEYLGIEFNGSRGNDHETFMLAPHLLMENGGFCKTARKPYDVVVVACLIIMSSVLPEVFQFESDGDCQDMLDSMILIENAIGNDNELFRIPETIQFRRGA
jgi:hypothetical protein